VQQIGYDINRGGLLLVVTEDENAAKTTYWFKLATGHEVWLMDTDFAIIGPLVRRRRPLIQFLSIGSYLCSTLPSDPTSR
jgi:hypothetical protein